MKPGQESCVRSSGIITLSTRGSGDEACLRGGQNDQSCRGHHCSKTTPTGESRFHISTPQGIWTQVPCDGKQTGNPLASETWWECSEIAGSSQAYRISLTNGNIPKVLCKYLRWWVLIYWHICIEYYVMVPSLLPLTRPNPSRPSLLLA
jgi:hypothetical protein